MIYRILPLISVVIMIAFFAFLIFKKKRGVQFFKANRITSIVYGVLILALHLTFTIDYALIKGVYLYLLHTDICTMLYPWVSITLIFNFKKLETMLFPLAITGAFFELATQQMTFTHEFAFEEIMSYIKHIMLLLAGIYILINQTNYHWREFAKTIGWFAAFVVYILLVTGIPYWVTGNPKFGTFSMGLIKTSYGGNKLPDGTFGGIQVSWTGKNIYTKEFAVLNSLGYPFGTIALIIVACIFGSSATLAAVISSKYKVKETKQFIPELKRLIKR